MRAMAGFPLDPPLFERDYPMRGSPRETPHEPLPMSDSPQRLLIRDAPICQH